jgi:hypothetical protein
MPAAHEDNTRSVQAKQLVSHYMFGSITTQFVPTLPLFEHVIQAEVLVQLVRSLANIYAVTFLTNRARELVRQLIGEDTGLIAFKLLRRMIEQSATLQELGHDGKDLLELITNEGIANTASDLLKATIPGAKLVLGYEDTIEILSTVYAVGHVFILHFETGGTLQTFDPPSFKQDFEEQTRAGREIAILRLKAKE